MESAAYLQSTEKNEEKQETELTKSMKRQFPLFGLGSLLYSLFYAFCLYENTSGITYPFFVIGTLCYFFFSMQKLGVPFKKDNVFYIVSIVLLGLSNCMTASLPILFMNKCGIFLLTLMLMLHTLYNDKEWNFSKYFCAIFRTLCDVFACLLRPFGDMISYFDAQKREKPEKTSYFLPILTGVLIAIPLLFFMAVLLGSADIIFFLELLETSMDFFDITAILRFIIFISLVFLFSYALFAGLCKKGIEEKREEKTLFDPVVAIVVTSLLSVLYLFFSGFQFFVLFGNMTLPDGETYSGYARAGFFQLLIACVINLILVLVCLHFFRESRILQGILTVICGCTFVLMLSSLLRLLMYINAYALTFLRVLALWSLAVIFLLMIEVTIYIYNRDFRLFSCGVITVTICYLILSFSHPDFLVACYDINCDTTLWIGPDHDEYVDDDRLAYLSNLSADAAPAILNPSINPRIISVEHMLEKTAVNDDGTFIEDYCYDYFWIKCFYEKMEEDTWALGVRDFNFSLYQAKQYIKY